MEINPCIFKAYDIRGKYPGELTEDVAFAVGKALVCFLEKKEPKIVIGMDNRLSSASLSEGLISGIVSEGGRVVFLGPSTSAMLYWTCARYGFDGGIEVTASHNPKEYNGFKLVKSGGVPIGESSGLEKIRKMVLEMTTLLEKKKRKISQKNVLSEYLKFNLKGFPTKKFKKLKIIIDTANGVSGIVVQEFLKKLDLDAIHIFQELDGSFPNHGPNPIIAENLSFLKDKIGETKADFGIAFDGDGDRLVFVDEKGEAVSGDLLAALISENLLKDNPGEKIAYDIRSSNIVRETVLKNGGIPVLSKVGHAFIKQTMRENNALFGGEVSGHFYHRNHYFCEAPLFVLLKVIQTISESGKTLSHLIDPFKIYYNSGEINFEIADRGKIMEEVKNRYNSGRISETDGLRVDFPDWWFLVRPSNTEPLLRLIIEAKSPKLAEEKKRELTALFGIS